ncbi:helix-turn-helix domain-containing protein [Duganella sp. FT134W]|uniref:Helix-turn-helix domain-containing protein n=1 Tax=Duganella margarita TaxID=2692170 RepID=A0A7X4H605_9BURK|nr:Crp/Fnr family transcriptional regulator [Duganella margarita]MYM76008.1 helix-turn-helix domain-containing protein [Duganella margarita]
MLNALLSARTTPYSRLAERVRLPANATLHFAGQALRWLYFPVSAVISVQQVRADGTQAELCVVGQDGVAGLASCLSEDATLATQLLVSVGGDAYRTPVKLVRPALRQPGPAQDMLLRCLQNELAQVGQLSACACLHGTEQRLIRWLLAMAEFGLRRLKLTHEGLAAMLGVRRESITAAVRRLHALGLVDAGRGRIDILLPEGLRPYACECHELLQREAQRLRDDLLRLVPTLHAPWPPPPHDGGAAALPPLRWQSPSDPLHPTWSEPPSG